MKICTRCHHEAEDAQFKYCRACREYFSKRYQEKREYILDYNRQRYRGYIEAEHARSHKYAKEHPEKAQERWQKWYPEHVEEKLTYCHQWYLDNTEQHHESCARWEKANPEKRRALKHNRRARIKGNGGTFTFKELNELFEQQEGFCAYCGELLYSSFDKEVHIDHKIPLSRGGHNDISNIALSCARCNLQKGTKTDEEFLQARNA